MKKLVFNLYKTNYRHFKIVVAILMATLISSCGSKTETPSEQVSISENSVTLTDAQNKNSGIVIGKMEEKSI